MKLLISRLVFATAALALLAITQRQPLADTVPTAATNPNVSRPDSKPDMIKVAEGRFTMGDKSQPDAPLHPAQVSSFYIDKYLVTQELYRKVMQANPSRWKGDKNPVEQVRWSDAVKFCNKRSQLEGLEKTIVLLLQQPHVA